MISLLRNIIVGILPYVALITILWTIVSGVKSFVNYSRSKKDEQISKALQFFSEDNKIKKLSSLAIIDKNINVILDEIFLIYALESDFIIRKLIEKSLCNSGKKAFNKSLQYNKEFVSRICENNFGSNNIIPKYLIDYIKHNVDYYRISSEVFNKYEIEEIYKNYNEEDKMDYIKRSIEYIIISSKIIVSFIKKHRFLFKIKYIKDDNDIKDVLLISTDVYKAKLKNFKISKSVLYKNIMRHLNICNSRISFCLFDTCDLISADLKLSSISNVEVRKSKLINSIQNKCNLSMIKLTSNDLGKSKFLYCTINKMNSRSSSLNGSNFIECVLDKNVFVYTSFIKAEFKDSDIISCRFLGNNTGNKKKVDNDMNNEKEKRKIKNQLINSEFINCNLKNVDFGGSDLKDVCFYKCKLYNVNFFSAEMKNVKFTECTLNLVNFGKSKNLDTIVFDKCNEIFKQEDY